MRSCSDLAAVERESFLAAMRRAGVTVTVVTTAGPAGGFSLTVSAIRLVSADPPGLLVGIHHASPAVQAIVGNGVFAVNLLDDSQNEISEIFAGRRAEARPSRDARLDQSCDGCTTAAGRRRSIARRAARVRNASLFVGVVVDVAYALWSAMGDLRPLGHTASPRRSP
jgi:flavin reductase (DIM6/NTAB) family NADH-FMN oxidoreductase RutF